MKSRTKISTVLAFIALTSSAFPATPAPTPTPTPDLSAELTAAQGKLAEEHYLRTAAEAQRDQFSKAYLDSQEQVALLQAKLQQATQPTNPKAGTSK